MKLYVFLVDSLDSKVENIIVSMTMHEKSYVFDYSGDKDYSIVLYFMPYIPSAKMYQLCL